MSSAPHFASEHPVDLVNPVKTCVQQKSRQPNNQLPLPLCVRWHSELSIRTPGTGGMETQRALRTQSSEEIAFSASLAPSAFPIFVVRDRVISCVVDYQTPYSSGAREL